MVDHEILLTKLLFYGIRGRTNKWFYSDLTERKQFVSISVFLSNTRIVQCGVPQGSTLGPLLFLLYINDLADAFKHCTIHHFTDRNNLLYAKYNIQNIEDIMNAELKKTY